MLVGDFVDIKRLWWIAQVTGVKLLFKSLRPDVVIMVGRGFDLNRNVLAVKDGIEAIFDLNGRCSGHVPLVYLGGLLLIVSRGFRVDNVGVHIGGYFQVTLVPKLGGLIPSRVVVLGH